MSNLFFKGIKAIKEKGLIGAVNWYFLHRNTYWIGRLVELTGNRIRLSGCTFDVDTQCMLTSEKSQFLQGRYERDERYVIANYLPADVPVIELGGFIGVVSCVANKKLANPKQHIVVEADPEVAKKLAENRALNGANFTIINKAIAYHADTVTFYRSGLIGSVYHKADHSITVPTITLSEVYSSSGFDKFNLICDIEGSESDVVANDFELLSSKVGLVIVEVHDFIMGERKTSEFLEGLKNAGFRLIYHNGLVSVFENVAR